MLIRENRLFAVSPKVFYGYLQFTKQLAIELETHGEKIELLLFTFGYNPKTTNITKGKISNMVNGYCPESLLKGKVVRMRQNRNDFFESVETGL